MVSPQQGLKGLAGTTGFFLGAFLLSVGGTAAFAQNTAYGTGALQSNTTGTDASAFGFNALYNNTTGGGNTASGYGALSGNTTGSSNTASGYGALSDNTTGNFNTASGVDALTSNTTGNGNTASGVDVLFSNTTGNSNTASGDHAFYNNTTGNNNTANGDYALYNSTTGKSNIGLGYNAGNNIVTGSNNIEIWANPSNGIIPFGDESNTIRIGFLGTQKETFIAGISGTPVVGADVTVDGNGQLGVLPSSARYKRDIHDMGGASAGLMKLRPVTFRYKSDPSGTLQYGLVAEEVARVYPELVVRGPDGKVQSVRYLELTALLLNELQKLDERMQTKDQQLAAQQREIDALKQKDASINGLNERLAALEQQAREVRPERIGSLAIK
jgi:hypothetical protein